MEKYELSIEFMHCGACATGIQMAVSQLSGVKSIFVDYKGKKANIELDESKTRKEEVTKQIEELGYKAF